MSDVHSKEVRSFNMSQIKGKDTTPELIVRHYLFARGFRYRLHSKNLPGKPDIVFPKYHTVLFVNGCFWHGHSDCRYANLPKTRTEWWLAKINKTRITDDWAIKSLRSTGWNVIVIWECALKKKILANTLEELVDTLYRMKNSRAEFTTVSSQTLILDN